MTFKELAREICKREGKKQGVNIAQVSEILRCLGDILLEKPGGVKAVTVLMFDAIPRNEKRNAAAFVERIAKRKGKRK
jgi:hypothetical protein